MYIDIYKIAEASRVGYTNRQIMAGRLMWRKCGGLPSISGEIQRPRWPSVAVEFSVSEEFIIRLTILGLWFFDSCQGDDRL